MAVFNRISAKPFVERLVYSSFVENLKTRYGYPLATRVMGTNARLFLNYGYEEDPPMAVPLATSDEPYRFCIQQYHRVASQVDLAGRQVLEVGCGHGGGASYLVRTFDPASYTGLDLNPAGIGFCRRTYRLPGLDFVRGDAENLPFPDQSFDAVINVESSHCYPQFTRFLGETARVLRAGGHLLYTDLRHRVAVADWEAALAEAPMRIVSQRAINVEIVRGLERSSRQWQELIDRHLPGYLRGLARSQTPLPGGRLYRAVQSGECSYRMYCLVKD